MISTTGSPQNGIALSDFLLESWRWIRFYGCGGNRDEYRFGMELIDVRPLGKQLNVFLVNVMTCLYASSWASRCGEHCERNSFRAITCLYFWEIMRQKAKGDLVLLVLSVLDSNSEFIYHWRKNSKFTENSKIDSKFTENSKIDSKFIVIFNLKIDLKFVVM